MILTDRVLTARQYAEGYSSMYVTRCDTYDECVNCLMLGAHIYPSRPITLTEFPEKYDEKKNYVLVEFSMEGHYTEHEYCYMTVQKKYLSRFKKYLEELEKEIEEFLDEE